MKVKGKSKKRLITFENAASEFISITQGQRISVVCTSFLLVFFLSFFIGNRNLFSAGGWKKKEYHLWKTFIL